MQTAATLLRSEFGKGSVRYSTNLEHTVERPNHYSKVMTTMTTMTTMNKSFCSYCSVHEHHCARTSLDGSYYIRECLLLYAELVRAEWQRECAYLRNLLLHLFCTHFTSTSSLITRFVRRRLLFLVAHSARTKCQRTRIIRLSMKQFVLFCGAGIRI